MREINLTVEPLEERIAPTLCLVSPGVTLNPIPNSPDPAGFPSLVHAGQLGAWNAHFGPSPVVGITFGGPCFQLG